MERGNETAIRTAELITEVFSAYSTAMRTHSSKAKFSALQLEMNCFYRILRKYKKDHRSSDYKRLYSLLRPESRFASFKGDYIYENKNWCSDLAELL